MKKLIPALAMLLVAACLMGTSTYAWFSANEDVTATGMAVKAAADGGLAIGSWKYDADDAPMAPETTDFKTSAEAVYKVGNATVKPVSLNNGTWYTGTANENTSYAPVMPEGENTTLYSEVLAADLPGYYQATKWDIKSLDATGATYTLKVVGITVDASERTTQGQYLNKALRVAIKVGSTWTVFAPLADNSSKVDITDDGVANATFNHVSNVNTATQYADGALKVGTNNASTGVTPYDVSIHSSLGTAPVTVEVFVYYEGEDANCKTQNIAADVDDLKVTISYSASKNS